MSEDKIISKLEPGIKRAEYVNISYVNGVDVDLLSSFLEFIKRKNEALASVKHAKNLATQFDETMREILFRGKTKAITGCPYNNGKPDGEWVFGYVFSDLGAMKIRQYETDRPECNDYEVDPETVGQYTGLTDKNRTKIFEWDIVKCTDDTGIENIFIIRWDSRRAMFYLDSPTFKTDFYYYFADELEVIGNIHDNPELLGELMKLTSKDVAQSGLAPATENFELMPG